MNELCGQMGYTVEQVSKLEAFHQFDPAMLTFVSCVWAIMACVFLVWVRDCFLPEKVQTVVKAYQPVKPEEEAAWPAASSHPRMRLDN